jgi:ribonucleoside-diphosphate reductase alpha chain
MNKQGSMISGLLDTFATLFSIALQYGVPLAKLIDKMKGTRFEPSGFTRHEEIPIAKSIMDYIGRWLEIKFLSNESDIDNEFNEEDEEEETFTPQQQEQKTEYSGDVCKCGGMLVQTGSCTTCRECGEGGGCG